MSRILIVEDEKKIARFLELELTHEGYEVQTAGDGRSGLEQAQSWQPDLLILDLMLPELSGIEVCRRLRHDSDVPIIMLTAKDDVSDKVMGLDMGADDYMTKPFAIEELLARIRAMTRAQRGMDSNRLTMGNVTLDLTTYELSTPAGSFRLTGKEFQMMEMLLSNQRRLIPTERFLEKIWGYDTDAEVHVVWVYISYLRKKLASLGATVQIRVARNAGYSLEEIP